MKQTSILTLPSREPKLLSCSFLYEPNNKTNLPDVLLSPHKNGPPFHSVLISFFIGQRGELPLLKISPTPFKSQEASIFYQAPHVFARWFFVAPSTPENFANLYAILQTKDSHLHDFFKAHGSINWRVVCTALCSQAWGWLRG